MNYIMKANKMLVHSSKFMNNLDDECIQPNAVDLRIASISKIDNNTTFVINESEKKHRDNIKVPLMTQLSEGLQGTGRKYWTLDQGQYQFETDHFVEIPEGYAGWLIARSTLNRNGVFVTSGLYDSGFKNTVGGVLHVSGKTEIDINTRIAQFIMLKAETEHLYDGDYNVKEGN